jgi:high affinity Mn2+ porin
VGGSLAQGGSGILIGDGRLPHPGPEEIVETYCKIALNPHAALSFGAQLAANPAYTAAGTRRPSSPRACMRRSSA